LKYFFTKKETVFKEEQEKKMNSEWVDQLLSFYYYGYSLTEENIDEFENNGLLMERYAWVDRKLENMSNNEEEEIEWDDDDLLLQPAPITWCNYRSGAILECIEKEKEKKRCESDISDYEEEVDRAISALKNDFEYSDSEYSSINDYEYDFGYDSF
jgi:hypothetical protein